MAMFHGLSGAKGCTKRSRQGLARVTSGAGSAGLWLSMSMRIAYVTGVVGGFREQL